MNHELAGAYILVWCELAMNGGLEDQEYEHMTRKERETPIT
jgi:hypothetical protein